LSGGKTELELFAVPKRSIAFMPWISLLIVTRQIFQICAAGRDLARKERLRRGAKFEPETAALTRFGLETDTTAHALETATDEG